MPPLIKTALLKERAADKENNIDIKEIQRLYGAIRYENQTYPVKIPTKNPCNLFAYRDFHFNIVAGAGLEPTTFGL